MEINRNEDTRAVDTEPYRSVAMALAELTHSLDRQGIHHNMYNHRALGRRLSDPAAIYEFLKSRLWEYSWLAVHSGLLKDPRRPLRVLDFGCGGSIFGAYLAQLGFETTVLDYAGAFGFQNQRSIASALGLEKLTICEGGIEKTSFAPNTFDYVFSISVIEHMIPVLPKAFAELERILVPGGVLALTANFNLVRYDPSEYFPWSGHWPLDIDLLRELEKRTILSRIGNKEIRWDISATGTGYFRNGQRTTNCGGNRDRPYFNLALFYEKPASAVGEVTDGAQRFEGFFESLPYTVRTQRPSLGYRILRRMDTETRKYRHRILDHFR